MLLVLLLLHPRFLGIFTALHCIRSNQVNDCFLGCWIRSGLGEHQIKTPWQEHSWIRSRFRSLKKFLNLCSTIGDGSGNLKNHLAASQIAWWAFNWSCKSQNYKTYFLLGSVPKICFVSLWGLEKLRKQCCLVYLLKHSVSCFVLNLCLDRSFLFSIIWKCIIINKGHLENNKRMFLSIFIKKITFKKCIKYDQERIWKQ